MAVKGGWGVSLMGNCAECGSDIKDSGWAVGRLKKKFLIMQRVCDFWVCSRPCAEKLMRRLEDNSPTSYHKKKD